MNMDFISFYNNVMGHVGNKYLQFVIIVALFFAIAKLIVFIGNRHLLKVANKTKTEIDNIIIMMGNKPLSLIIFLFGLKLGFAYLKLSRNDLVQKTLNSLIIFVLAFFIISLTNIIISRWGQNLKIRKSKVDEQIVVLTKKVVNLIIFLIVLMIILRIWGIQIGPLLASLGIAGVAIAFALQNTLGNVFGGVSMIIDKTIRVGDTVKVGELVGKVIDVGIRSTRIKTFDNEEIIIPNGKLSSEVVINYAKPDPSARVGIKFGVEYGSDVEKVKKVVLKAVKKIEGVLEEPEPRVWFLEMGDFALRFKVVFWVSSYRKRFLAKEKANCLIYDELRKNKIGIPFPTETVYVKMKKK